MLPQWLTNQHGCSQCGSLELVEDETDDATFEYVAAAAIVQVRKSHICQDCGYTNMMVPPGRDEEHPRRI